LEGSTESLQEHIACTIIVASVGSSFSMNDFFFKLQNIYKNKFFSLFMAEKKEVGEGLGISGFTLGILSIIWLGYIGLLMGIIGFIFCSVQQKNKKTKLGKAGKILNLIGFILSIVWILYSIFYLFPFLASQGEAFPLA
jgi:hypothetical protein